MRRYLQPRLVRAAIAGVAGGILAAFVLIGGSAPPDVLGQAPGTTIPIVSSGSVIPFSPVVTICTPDGRVCITIRLPTPENPNPTVISMPLQVFLDPIFSLRGLFGLVPTGLD